MIGEHPLHVFPELRAVVVLYQITKLVHHHIVQDPIGGDDDFPVEKNMLGADIVFQVLQVGPLPFKLTLIFFWRR